MKNNKKKTYLGSKKLIYAAGAVVVLGLAVIVGR